MTKSIVSSENVLVTGGADGIGWSIAQRFLEGGFCVHVCDIRESAVAARHGISPKLRVSVADIGNPADVKRLIIEAREWMGEIGVLVNNVGIGGPRAAIEDIELSEWEESLRVNVTGALLCMQQVIPAMKTAEGGAIINISTGSTRTCLPLRTPYIASKYALEGLTLNAARELGSFGIRCNAILPGVMNNTRMDKIVAQRAEEEQRSFAEVEMDYLRYISMRTRTEQDDVANTAFFLASPAAARITGELLSVSGGLEWEA